MAVDLAQKKKNIRMQCPSCAAIFLVQSGQREGLCYNCGRQLDIRTLERDKRASQLGWKGTYAELLTSANRLLADRKYPEAAGQFAMARRAAHDDSNACYGMLAARTKQFTDFSMPLPTDLYNAAMAAAATEDSEKACQIRSTWDKYEKAYREYQDTQRRLEEKRRRDRQRRQQNTAQKTNTGSTTPSSEAQSRKRRAWTMVVRFLLIGAGAAVMLLGLAACSAAGGGGALFFLLGAGLLGSGDRNRRNRR